MQTSTTATEHHHHLLPDGFSNMANQYGGRRLFRDLPIMVRTSRKSAETTWPFMEMFGMYRKKIDADGNCMFRALSDQLYDSPDRHEELRAKVVDHMRQNREEYEPFAAAFREEGLVSGQTRTRASRRSSRAENDEFEAYCKEMETPATYGQQLELRAFAEAYDRDIVIHQPTGMSNPFGFMGNQRRTQGSPVIYVHLAFGGEDVSPHYESVRQADKVAAASLSPPKQDDTVPEATPVQVESSPAESCDAPESLDRLNKARPNLSRAELVDLVDDCKESLDAKFAELIQRDRERSTSGSESRRSESSKRSRDDDDEETDAPERQAKRQSRGINRRNRTRALMSVTEPATSAKGTEISFHVRLDTPPVTPTQATAAEKAAAPESIAKDGIAPAGTVKDCSESEGAVKDCKEPEPPAKEDNAAVDENVADSKAKVEGKGKCKGDEDDDEPKPKQGKRGRARTRARGKARS